MVNSISRFAGGGRVYTPPMMEYDGASYADSATFTAAGNEVSGLVRFKMAEQSSAGVRYLMAVRDGSSNINLGIVAFDTDHADADRANTIQCFSQDSGTVNVCRLITPTGLLDGTRHTLKYGYNATTGVAYLIVDGEDMDDTGNADRIAPTTSTLGSGAGAVFHLGHSGGGSNKVADGDQIGPVGYAESYLPDWDDFMFPGGYLKELDVSGWSEFGSQPRFYSPAGDPINLGDIGDLTVTGSIIVGTGGSTGHPIVGIRTAGDATETDILSGKTAWVEGEEIVGTLSGTAAAGGVEGIMCIYNGPKGGSGAHDIDIEEAIIRDSDITNDNPASTIATDGFQSIDSAFAGVGFSNVAAKGEDVREYSVVFKGPASPATNDGIVLQFNRNNNSNYWGAFLGWTGSAWRLLVLEYTAAAPSVAHITLTMATDVDDPVLIKVVILDTGDGITASMQGVETDALVDEDAVADSYSVPSRPHKTETGFGIRNWSATNYEWNHLTVRDLG